MHVKVIYQCRKSYMNTMMKGILKCDGEYVKQ